MFKAVLTKVLSAVFLLQLITLSTALTVYGISSTLITYAATKKATVKNSNTNQFICSTIIFPIINFNNNNFPIFQNYQEKDQYSLTPKLIYDGNYIYSSPNNFSYRNYEYTDNDIINSVAYGLQKFGVNCAAIFIDLRMATESVLKISYDSPSSYEMIGSTMVKLYTHKIARQHKDYFIFIQNGGQDLSENTKWNSQTILNGKSKNFMQLLSEIRYKYFISIRDDKSLAQPENLRPFFNLINSCALQHQNLPLFSRRCDSVLNSRHFRITCTNIQSMTRPDSEISSGTANRQVPSPKTLAGGGMLYSMIQEASTRYNFTFNIHLAGFNGATGMKKEINGKLTWVGAVGELFSDEADISFGAGTTYDRHRIVDPSIMHTWFTRVFYIKPPPTRSSWVSILWPLNGYVWVSLLVTACCVLAPVYYLAVRVNFSMRAGRRQGENLLGQVLDAIYRVFMEQAATTRNWTHLSLRLLLMLWTLTVLVLETAYRCKLVVFLSFAVKEDYPKTHEELATYADPSKAGVGPTYKLYFRYYGGAAYKDYKSSANPMHATFLQHSSLVNNSIECLEAVLASSAAEPGACMDFVLNGDYTITANFTLPRKSISMEESISNGQLFIKSIDTDLRYCVAWAFKKGSRWTESFDRIVLNYFASGLYDYWLNYDWAITRKRGLDYWKIVQQQAKDDSLDIIPSSTMNRLKLLLGIKLDTNGPIALDTSKFKGLFLIFGIGLGIGCLCFVSEFISKYICFVNKKDEKV